MIRYIAVSVSNLERNKQTKFQIYYFSIPTYDVIINKYDFK